MKANVPKNINIVKVITKLAIQGVAGVAAYYFTDSVVIGLIVYIVVLLVSPLLIRAKLNNKYKRYLEKFGEEFGGEFTDQIYESSIMGFIPFDQKVVSCFVYADDLGVLIRKRSVKRFLMWKNIVNYELMECMGQPVVEFTIQTQDNTKKLVIPWCKEFSEYFRSA